MDDAVKFNLYLMNPPAVNYYLRTFSFTSVVANLASLMFCTFFCALFGTLVLDEGLAEGNVFFHGLQSAAQGLPSSKHVLLQPKIPTHN
jgi:hypothetical protein